MIVLDASAVLAWLLRLEPAAAISRRFQAPGESLHAPHLLNVEVLHGLRRHALRGKMSRTRGDEALEDLLDVDVSLYPHAPLAGRVWELRENLTAYDAAYVALAEALDAPLITTDGRLARAPGHSATVELFG
ncbi:PIN domain-containing protein [Rubrobacter marinus]|uniref:Ribonuclease VapC n=1 Tax=Rubrobacter marinus TaxID=2653852 RepID=A0A6G8PWQ2_9ACTN|nr:type II toxin-antitoxin system VapC family toxin [Rubrobacter marinus]QIN78628.1 PIN domain-containing protein [Rubrobacter marinus]